jgi:hypothetical protein
MAKSIMVVESRPKSQDDVDDYHHWYEQVHIPELLSVDCFVSARRFMTEDGGGFLAIYELDADVATAKAALAEAQSSGRLSPPVGLSLDPPPSVRYFSLRGEFDS